MATGSLISTPEYRRADDDLEHDSREPPFRCQAEHEGCAERDRDDDQQVGES